MYPEQVGSCFHLMAASKKGVSAHQLMRTLGWQYRTAWFLAHRIREAMRTSHPNRWAAAQSHRS